MAIITFTNDETKKSGAVALMAKKDTNVYELLDKELMDVSLCRVTSITELPECETIDGQEYKPFDLTEIEGNGGISIDAEKKEAVFMSHSDFKALKEI